MDLAKGGSLLVTTELGAFDTHSTLTHHICFTIEVTGAILIIVMMCATYGRFMDWFIRFND